MSEFNEQMQKMKTAPGFIAALDQSGGSTPHALNLYGIKDDAWSNEAEMFALVHQMRTRIITSPSFTGQRILGAILFANTMDRDIERQATGDYLWNMKRVVPFLKVDKGLEPEKDGVQLMKPIPQLAGLLEKARSKRIFGTKMRSVIKQANAASINKIVSQQFELAELIIEMTGAKSRLRFEPLPSDDPKQRQPDISMAKSILKWEPKIPLREGLMKTIAYFETVLRKEGRGAEGAGLRRA